MRHARLATKEKKNVPDRRMGMKWSRAGAGFHDCPSVTDHEYSYRYTFVYRRARRRTAIHANGNKTNSFGNHKREREERLGGLARAKSWMLGYGG